MKCPSCSFSNDRVVESRSLAEGSTVRRRRECLGCGYRFTSYERLEDKPLMVFKRNGTKEFFTKEKVLRGIGRAIEKRPVTIKQAEDLVENIAEELNKKPARLVTVEEIGQLIMQKLAVLDEVAYVRFASVYKKFKDVNQFIDEIKNL